MACNRKALLAILPLCLAVCVQLSLASLQFRVGGLKGWTVPTGTETETYNQWAERNRFQVNDSLYFKYNKDDDSVLLVTKEAYNTCDTSNPIANYDDGNTRIKFPHSGPFYFISGAPGNCAKGQKLIVVVLASSGKAPVASSPSPSPFQAGTGNGNSSNGNSSSGSSGSGGSGSGGGGSITSSASTGITLAAIYLTSVAAVVLLPQLILP